MTATNIDDFMTRAPITVAPTLSLREAGEVMRDHNIHHLAVEAEIPCVLSARDLDWLRRRTDRPLLVSDLMRPAVTAARHDPVAAVARRMCEESRDAALIVDDARVVGIFTAHDALRALATEPIEDDPGGQMTG